MALLEKILEFHELLPINYSDIDDIKNTTVGYFFPSVCK